MARGAAGRLRRLLDVRRVRWFGRDAREAPLLASCQLTRETISARFDGEEVAVDPQVVQLHVSTCDACAEFEEGVAQLSRTLRVRSFVATPDNEAKILSVLGCTEDPPVAPSRGLKWSVRGQADWIRATQWAAGVVPLGVAVPALLLGSFAHFHFVASHAPSPCTASLLHRVMPR